MTEWRPESAPAQLINHAARLFALLHDSRLRALGITAGQIPVLGSLADGSALTQKELATRSSAGQPAMAELLARMQRDGLIQRTPHPNDRRSSLVALTDQAKSLLPEAREVLARGHADALTGFDESEIQHLAALLTRLIANLEEAVSSADDSRKDSTPTKSDSD
ncbi:MarR family transcriptional regulator [Nocardia colli]|uniref:MarR family transcriptional regulator n=1 Tax=Nocardia colli TaxID=2545717 RepID=A0A5N0EDQ3_9NOCA|nr:MarR family transcriptional regulator [Nocardia colli]KAA8887046.1 MarR family transcriptional regulator [Nocardia colli]